MIIASSQGGVNIEDVAATNPDAITYEPIDIMKGITDEQVKRVLQKVLNHQLNQENKELDILLKVASYLLVHMR